MKKHVLHLVLATAVVACIETGTAADKGGIQPSSLPILQTNVGGDASIEWRYANAVLGCEVWILDSSYGAEARDRFQSEPRLLEVPLTESGWPRELPDGVTVTISPRYARKADPTAGQLRSAAYENLTGLYVITWKGKTLPDRKGGQRFEVLDTINDGDPIRGTKILEAGDHRVIALVRDTARGVSVRYEKPDPSDPIRDIKIWTPLYQGAGLNVKLTNYDASRLGPGMLKAWCTEPGGGEPEPLWHPVYLKHLREDPSQVLRFMGFLEINGLEGDKARMNADWRLRRPAHYTIGGLVAISPANWRRHALVDFRGGGQVPYEWLFDLCARTGKDPWVQAPHVASDTYLKSLASLAAAYLPKGRRLWFEFSNELWNNYGPYVPQYQAAEAEGRRYNRDQGWGSGHLQASALKTFETAWLEAGRDDDELVNVLSGFALSPEYNGRVLAGAKAIAQDVAEVFAITTYFGASLTSQLFALSYGKKGGPDEGLYRQAAEIIRKDIHDTYQSWEANAQLCRREGVPLVAYEGGSHITATGYGDQNNPSHAAFMEFLANLHKHPLIAELYLEHWAFWTAAGGRTASMWTDIGSYGYYGYWGAREDVTEGPDGAPRAAAALTFAERQAGIRALDDPIGRSPRFEKNAQYRIEAGVSSTIFLKASDGDGPLRSALLGGEIPPGMSVSHDGSEGFLLTGVPLIPGHYLFIARISDSDGDPDYAVLDVTVDPKGTSGGRLILFDTGNLPLSKLDRAEGREDYRSRFDITPSRSFIDDVVSLGPRRYIPFDPAAPLFAAHYQDSSVTIAPSSPFALSGGLALTLKKEEFLRTNPAVAGLPAARAVNAANTSTLLWFGYRGGLLAGWVGSSLDIKPDTSRPEGARYGVPTRFDALLIWRRDQMDAPRGSNVSFGRGEEQAALVLETAGSEADETIWRFVIRTRTQNGVQYYISEASWNTSAGERISLVDFNNNSSPGKRWALFTPTPSDFAMPDDRALSFRAVDFSQVDGIGIVVRAQRFGWHYGFGISRFLAIGGK
jgi:hypothetical protein